MPDIVHALPGTAWFGCLARVVFASMFWTSGLAKLLAFGTARAEMAHFGLYPPVLFILATSAVQFAGSALIIGGRHAWPGAGMLTVFTALTIPIAHTFRTMAGPMRTLAFCVVAGHVTVIGAFMLVAVLSRQAETRGVA